MGGARDAACPISTGCGTRCVHLVRGGGEGGGDVGARNLASMASGESRKERMFIKLRNTTDTCPAVTTAVIRPLRAAVTLSLRQSAVGGERRGASGMVGRRGRSNNRPIRPPDSAEPHAVYSMVYSMVQV